MLTLSIDPSVLDKLKESFPKPRNSAEKALLKYKELLEELVFKAPMRGRSNYETLLNLYSIPLSELTHKGPQIDPMKVIWLLLGLLLAAWMLRQRDPARGALDGHRDEDAGAPYLHRLRHVF